MYSRDGRFRGTAKRRFSVPLLMTRCHQIDLQKSKINTELYFFCCTGRQKCTKLHRFAPIFSKKKLPLVTPPDPYNWGGVNPTFVGQHLLANICVTHDNILLDNSMAEMADSADDDDDVAAAVICLIACKRKRRQPKSVWVQAL